MLAFGAAVGSVLENLAELLVAEISLANSTRAQLEALQTEVRKLSCFLKHADEKQESDQRVRDFLDQTMGTLYEADYMIDEFFFTHCLANRYSCRSFCRVLPKCIRNREVDKIVVIKDRIRAITKNLGLHGLKSTTAALMPEEGELRTMPDTLHISSVGLKDEVENLVTFLLQQQDETSSLVAIVGMGGIGKTTLARRVYHHPQLQGHFQGFAWANVSRTYEPRDILESIFLQLAPDMEEEIRIFNNFELIQHLFDIQLSNKCLIVLDDVWDLDAWRCLNLAFPSHNTASGLVVTTRSQQVAQRIADKGVVHKMQSLTGHESWELFMEKAFSGRSPRDNLFNKQMLEISKNLVDECRGLPLAIVLLANILSNKHTLDDWELLLRRFDLYSRRHLVGPVPHLNLTPEMLALHNYFDLPHYLKPCFIYLGVFQEDVEVKMLYDLWICEGLISTSQKGLNTMDMAERYLDELIDRSMVQVQEKKASTGLRFKTVRLHDLMRDLCVAKAKEENFMEVADFAIASSPMCSIPMTRRLALYLDRHHDEGLGAFNSDKTQHLLSFLLLNRNQYQKDTMLPPGSLNLKHLRSLRILHFDRFNFGTWKSLGEIGELTSLKYLNLRECSLVDELPSSIGDLCNLRTLNLQVNTRICVPNVLWKLKRLRHLCLPCQFWVHREKRLRLGTLLNLETLQNFDGSLCNIGDLIKLNKLRLLEVTAQGNLDELEAIANQLSTMSTSLLQSSLNIRGFDRLSGRSVILIKLFECPTLHVLHIEGPVGNIPRMISPSLSELVLSGAKLEEDAMVVLEKFPLLCILILKNDAFLGKQILFSASGFPKLRLLRLSNLHNLERLSIERGAMPNLSTLAIERCNRFEGFPEGFSHVRSLKCIKIPRCYSEYGLGT